MSKKCVQWALCSLLLGSMHQSVAGSYNEFSAGPLFLRPGGSNDYAVLVNPLNPNVTAPILSPSWEAKGINAHFAGGFLLNFKHVFCNGNDVSLYWAHVQASDSDTFPVTRTPASAQQMTGPFWNIGPDATPTSNANGRLENHYDVLNAEVGKQVRFQPDLDVRFFAGLSGLWLEQEGNADFSGVDPILGPYTFGITTQSKFHAAGMRVGFNGEYQITQGFSALGLFAGNLFIGRQSPSTTTRGAGSILTTAGIIPENYQSISHQRYIQLVPALDAKLGLQYTKQDCNHRTYTIEGGYMASIYINAMQNYVPSTYAPGTLGIVSGSIYLQSLLKNTESFSVDGPYLSFTIKFD